MSFHRTYRKPYLMKMTQAITGVGEKFKEVQRPPAWSSSDPKPTNSKPYFFDSKVIPEIWYFDLFTECEKRKKQ
ncbi:hypothetical protein CsatB_012112 [Cannabis sativa]|uniref:Uncharacterized protein n=1 Tax=Cannabis sativa TaxID=3483 RepID=A0A803QVK5_CANSA